MVSAKTLRRSLAALIGLIIVGLIGAYIFFTSHVHMVMGGSVERVDPAQFQREVGLTVIANTHILSEDGEVMIPNQTVVIDGGKISSIVEGVAIPETAEIIDGRGKYLIPGLIDSHVHLRRQPNDLLLYLANGVTHVRDFSGSKQDIKWKREIENGRVGPRINVLTPSTFTATGMFNEWFIENTRPKLNIGDGSTSEALVQSFIDEGYDGIKLYADTDVDAFDRLAKAAKAAGLHTAGHFPRGYTKRDLRTTDLQEIAHVEEIVKILQDEFRAVRGQLLPPDTSDNEHYAYIIEHFPAYAESRADEVVRNVAQKGIPVNSTLWLMQTLGDQTYFLEEELKKVPLEFANPAMVEGSDLSGLGWLPGRNRFESFREEDPSEYHIGQGLWRVRTEAINLLFREMIKQDVTIVAGTDATTELTVAGFSMHNELEELVRQGMKPSQSLKAATINPTILMGTNAGIIAPGRDADLVLLSASPLDDIRNTTKIDTVIAAGKVFDREALDEMLEAVKAAHAKSRKFDLSKYQ